MSRRPRVTRTVGAFVYSNFGDHHTGEVRGTPLPGTSVIKSKRPESNDLGPLPYARQHVRAKAEAGEGLERFAHRNFPPPTLPLQRRLLLLETLVPVHVVADVEDHPTVRFDDPHELVERFGRGVVRCEDP